MHPDHESWVSVKWFVEDHICFCLLLKMTEVVDQAGEGAVVGAVHPSGVVEPGIHDNINKLVLLPGIKYKILIKLI